jgi:hypothetical protein
MRRCVVCRHRPADAGVECEACKQEKRRLDALHDRFKRQEPEADRAGRALRVELYTTVRELGGALFETHTGDGLG